MEAYLYPSPIIETGANLKLGAQEGEVSVVAHRGGAALHTENTMTAFRKAQELGVDAIECDVHASKDGHLVITHDASFKRVYGVDSYVADLNLEDIRKIRLPGGESPPLLQDALEELDVPLLIELKSVESLTAIADLFEKHEKYMEKAAVISFYHEALLMLTDHYPSLTTGALLVGYPVDPVGVARSCGSDILSLYHEGIMRHYVERCHEGGLTVNVWTPNSRKEIISAVDAGVDSITSDRPDLVLEALGRS